VSRVLRGGAWNNNPRNCRAANRNDNAPDNRNNNIGFPGVSWCPHRDHPRKAPGRILALVGISGRPRFAGRGRGAIDGAGLSRPHALCASGA
jgi:hypothetical protein